jgi:hypothetical protein
MFRYVKNKHFKKNKDSGMAMRVRFPLPAPFLLQSGPAKDFQSLGSLWTAKNRPPPKKIAAILPHRRSHPPGVIFWRVVRVFAFLKTLAGFAGGGNLCSHDRLHATP